MDDRGFLFMQQHPVWPMRVPVCLLLVVLAGCATPVEPAEPPPMAEAPPAYVGDVVAYARVDDAGKVLDMARWQVVDSRWVWDEGWQRLWRLADLEDGRTLWINAAGRDAYRDYEFETANGEGTSFGLRATRSDDDGWSSTDMLVHGLVAASGSPLDEDWVTPVFGWRPPPAIYDGDAVMDVAPVDGGTQATFRIGDFTPQGDLWRGAEHDATFEAGTRYPTEVVTRSVYDTPFDEQRFVLVGFVPGPEREAAPPSWVPSASHAHPADEGPLSVWVREAMQRAQTSPVYHAWADDDVRLTGFSVHAPEEVGQPTVVRVVYGDPDGGSLGTRWSVVADAWSSHAQVFHTEPFEPTSAGVWSLADAEKFLTSFFPEVHGEAGYASWGQGWQDIKAHQEPRIHDRWRQGDQDLFLAFGNASGISTDASVGGLLGAGTGPQRESWLAIEVDARSGALDALFGVEVREQLVEFHGWLGNNPPPYEEADPSPSASMPARETGADWPPVVAGAAGLALLALMARFVPWFALYARLRGPRVVHHAARAEILAAIEAEPGISSTLLARRLEMSDGTMRHHLAVLRRERQVTRKAMRGRHHWFPQGRLPPRDQDAVALRRDGTRGRLLRLLEARPDSTAGDLAASLSISATAVRKQLRVLKEKGVIEGRRLRGRSIAFRVV